MARWHHFSGREGRNPGGINARPGFLFARCVLFWKRQQSPPSPTTEPIGGTPMCSSAPKVKPIPSAPDVGPTSIDDAAVNERDRERQRQRQRTGRQSTIMAGETYSAPTAPVKTATGQ